MLITHIQPVKSRILDSLQKGPRNLSSLLEDHLTALRVLDILGQPLTDKVVIHDQEDMPSAQTHLLDIVEICRQIFGGISHRLEEDRHRHLSPPVHPGIEDIFWVEFKIEPRTTNGDYARRVYQLSAHMGFPLVVTEKDPRRAVELTDNNTFGTVDVERPLLGHERDLTEVYLLLLDVANDLLVGAAAIVVENDKAYHHPQGSVIGHPPLRALPDIIPGAAYLITDEFQ